MKQDCNEQNEPRTDVSHLLARDSLPGTFCDHPSVWCPPNFMTEIYWGYILNISIQTHSWTDKHTADRYIKNRTDIQVRPIE